MTILLRFAALLLAVTPISSFAAEFDHSKWSDLLQKYVIVAPDGAGSSINYAAVGENRANLDIYLSTLSSVDRREFDGWTKKEQLAFLINAYNAWTVDLVLTGYPDIGSIRDLGGLTQSPWQKPFIPLFGKMVTLDDIEHGMIRGSGRYNDPRIHFAVNCASIGCPALANHAYVAADLDAQLDAATQAFLSDRSRNRKEADGLALSSIFNWYGGDFAKGWMDAESLEEFLALYADALQLTEDEVDALVLGEMPIRFLDYDWRLNDSKGPVAKRYSTLISPLWLIRGNPLLGAAALAILAGLVALLFYAVRRRQRKKASRPIM